VTPELRASDRNVIDGEVVAARVVGRPAPKAASRGGVPVLLTVTVVLLLATAIFGTLFVRERSAHDEDRRHLRTQSARAAQRAAAVAAELAVVRAQRDRLARAESMALSPAAAAAIRACVQHYAELERALTAPAGPVPPATGVTACINAEPYVR
jgi:hypothetical protein